MIPIDTPEDLADALGLLRRLVGLTQTAVGIELGTTPQRIGDYERGRMVANGKTLMRHLAAIGHRLAIVPLIETAPETGLSATETAETPSAGIPGGSGGSQGQSGASGAVARLPHPGEKFWWPTECSRCDKPIGPWSPDHGPAGGMTHIVDGGGPDWETNRDHVAVRR